MYEIRVRNQENVTVMMQRTNDWIVSQSFVKVYACLSFVTLMLIVWVLFMIETIWVLSVDICPTFIDALSVWALYDVLWSEFF